MTSKRSVAVALALLFLMSACGKSNECPIAETAADSVDGPQVEAGRILYLSSAAGSDQLFTVEPDGSDVVQVTRAPEGVTAAALSPNGSQVAFMAGDYVAVIDIDGRNEQQHTMPDTVGNPVWRPDGDAIVVQRSDRSFDVLEVAGGNRRQASPFDDNAFLSATGNAWADDGTSIAYRRPLDVGQKEIKIVDVETRVSRVLTTVPEVTGIAVSPDGSTIAYSARDAEFTGRNIDAPFDQGAIYLVCTNGEGIQELTTGTDAEDAPKWSPDGSKLLYTRRGLSSFAIHVVAVSGDTDAFVVAAQPESSVRVVDPIWSPTSTAFVYGDNGELWVTELEGNAQQLGLRGYPIGWAPLAAS